MPLSTHIKEHAILAGQGGLLTTAQAAAVALARAPIGGAPVLPVAPYPRRLTKAGYCLYTNFAAANFTLSGTDSAYWSISTVNGYQGIAASDTVEGVALNSKTGALTMLKVVASGNASQSGANTFVTLNANSLAAATGDQKFGLWVYLSTDTTTNSNYVNPGFSVNLSTANTFNGDSADYTWTLNSNQLRQGWNFLVFRADASSHPYGVTLSGNGSVPFTSTGLNKFRFYFTALANKTLTLYIDSLWSNFSQKPAVVLGFDNDGDWMFKANALSTLTQYGFKGVVNCPGNDGASDNTNNALTDYNGALNSNPNQLLTLAACYSAGWDIANHTINHTNTSNNGATRTQLLSDSQLWFQVTAMTAWQMGHGWDQGREFYAAPQGVWDPVTINRLKTWGYVMARMGQQGMNRHLTPFGYDNPMNMGWYQLDSHYSLGTSGANVTQWITDLTMLLFTYGSDVILGCHSIIPDVGTVTAGSTTGNGLQLYRTSLAMLCAQLQTWQQAGLIDVTTYTGLYYNLDT